MTDGASPIGMLWFDNSKASLEDKISLAAEYYEKKYGAKPNVCIVHPSMLAEKCQQNGISVRSSKQVMPNHLWIGVGHD